MFFHLLFLYVFLSMCVHYILCALLYGGNKVSIKLMTLACTKFVFFIVFVQLLSKSLYSFGCYSNVKGKFSKKYSKIFFSEAVRRMKLKPLQSET